MATQDQTTGFRYRPPAYPMGRLFAVIEDPARVEPAVAALRNALATNDICVLCGDAGKGRLTVPGAWSGAFGRVLFVHDLGIESRRVRRYETELAKGHYILEVYVPDADERGDAVAILRAHGAHFFNFYDRWAADEVTT